MSAMPVLLQIRFGLLRHVARIAAVGLAGDGIEDIADDVQRGNRENRIHHRRIRIGNQEHVALVNLLEPADARAIEADAFAEQVVLEVFYWDGKMLPHARQVDKSQVDDL